MFSERVKDHILLKSLLEIPYTDQSRSSSVITLKWIIGDFPDSVIYHEPYYMFYDKLHTQVFLAVITMNIYDSLTHEKLF